MTPRGGFFDDAPTHTLRAEGFDASEDGTGRGTPLVACRNVAQALTKSYAEQPDNSDTALGPNLISVKSPIVFDTTQVTSPVNRCNPQPGDACHPLAAGAHAPALCFSSKDYGADAGEIAPTLRAGGHRESHANAGIPPAVAFQESQSGCREYNDAGTLRASGPGHDPVGTRLRTGTGVRRLTPRECERLPGWPDDHTRWRRKVRRVGNAWHIIGTELIEQADGPRYKQAGNGITATVPAWFGARIVRFSKP